MISLIAFTRRGCVLGKRLAAELGGRLWTTGRLAEELGLPSCGSLGEWTKERFSDSEALVFVSASGIAVRAIAPFVRDKFSDPAVVSVDAEGRIFAKSQGVATITATVSYEGKCVSSSYVVKVMPDLSLAELRLDGKNILKAGVKQYSFVRKASSVAPQLSAKAADP